MEILSHDRAVALIHDSATVIPGGFGSCGHPDGLTQALEKRFLRSGHPCNLKIIFASGAGESNEEGLNRWSHDGMVDFAIGGFWGLIPKLTQKVLEGKIEGHNWPQGVISKLFSEIASNTTGVMSRIGLGTFVDPRLEGGVMNAGECRVSVQKINGQELLHYPAMKVDFALLRGTRADSQGNIDMSGEAALHDALAQAMAVKNCGGVVIVQVESLEAHISEKDVRIPGFLVDYVVVEGKGRHYPSYGHNELTDYGTEHKVQELIIAERASKELPDNINGKVINFGIGIPALIGRFIDPKRKISTTIESGVVGGVPWNGKSFGYAESPTAIIEQSTLFRFYEGGGIDTAFLGFAEIDKSGCVNASKFGGRVMGAGGFINIAQTARKIVFCGTFNTKDLEVRRDGKTVKVIKNGSVRKFVDKVQQITFDRKNVPNKRLEQVLVITERAVFELMKDGSLVIKEVYPGCTSDLF